MWDFCLRDSSVFLQMHGASRPQHFSWSVVSSVCCDLDACSKRLLWPDSTWLPLASSHHNLYSRPAILWSNRNHFSLTTLQTTRKKTEHVCTSQWNWLKIDFYWYPLISRPVHGFCRIISHSGVDKIFLVDGCTLELLSGPGFQSFTGCGYLWSLCIISSLN